MSLRSDVKLVRKMVGPDGDPICPGCYNLGPLCSGIVRGRLSDAELDAILPRCDVCGKNAREHGQTILRIIPPDRETGDEP